MKKLSAKQKKLAAFAEPRNKITRADIITAAKKKGQANGTKRGGKKVASKKSRGGTKKG